VTVATRRDDRSIELDDLLADTYIQARRDRRMMAFTEASSSTFTGALLTLAESNAAIRLSTRCGWTWSGNLTAVGTEAIVCLHHDGRRAVIRREAIVSLSANTSNVAVGDGVASLTLSIEGFLSDLAGLGDTVTVVADSGSTVQLSGIVHWAGADAVCIGVRQHEREQRTRGVSYIALAHVTAVITHA
jgi:hypothetical protein